MLKDQPDSGGCWSRVHPVLPEQARRARFSDQTTLNALNNFFRACLARVKLVHYGRRREEKGKEVDRKREVKEKREEEEKGGIRQGSLYQIIIFIKENTSDTLKCIGTARLI